jgi:hypothetical protein
MATSRRFIAKNGLDNGGLSVTNIGTPGSSLEVSGAFGVTLGATGTTNVTLPTSGTLATVAQLPTVNNGTLTLAVSGTGLSGSASFTANQSGSSTFTVTSNATNANTASTIVARDGSGNFSAGTITGSLTGAASLNVLKAGDTMTGALTMTLNTGQPIIFNAAAGTARRIGFQSASVGRWQAGVDGTTESGSNAGTNYILQRYDDAGTLIDNPLVVFRNTGTVQVTNALTAASVTATTFSGSGSGLTGIPNGALVNDSVTVGTTEILLGASSTTLAGLTSVTSTSFVGALTGNASSATTATTATTLVTGRTISITGDLSYTSPTFNGSANVTAAGTLATVNSSPQTDTFRKITVNGKGLTTATSAVLPADITTALGYTPVNDAGDTMTGPLILSADPTVALGAATKQYVDNVASGLNAHAACETATTATLASSTGGTITYSNGSGGVGATLTTTTSWGTIGGLAVSLTDRVLVKNEANQINNGVYVVTSTTVLTRATDFDDSPDGEVVAGDFVYIQQGTLGGTQWVQTAVDPIIGTNNIVFTQLSGSGTVTGGTGITVSGNSVALATGNTLSLFNLATNGLVARTAANTVTARSIAISGSGLSITNADGVSGNPTITSNATNANTVSTIVLRDGSGNFSAGTITASLTGNADTASNVIGGSAGQVLYQIAANDTGYVTNAAGVLQALTSGATPTWTTTPVLGGTNFVNIPNGALTNSSVTIGSTAISLGASSTTLTGLTSVTSTNFVGTATNSTNATITDDTTTNANEFVVWSPNSTGNNGLRVSSTKLLFNPSTGILTATGFSGNLTGSASLNVLKAGDTMTGNLGIGVAPTRQLSVGNNTDEVGAGASGAISTLSLGGNGGGTGVSTFAYDRATGVLTVNNGTVGSVTERLRLANNGNFGIGSNSPAAKLEVVATALAFQTYGTQNNYRVFSTDANPYYSVFLKSRGTSSVPTTVANNDNIGATQYYGYDGTADRQAAVIAGAVDGVPATSTVQGRFTLFTTPAGT